MQNQIENEISPNRIQIGAGTMEPLAVSVTECARLLNVSRPKVYELIHMENGIKSFHIGSRTLIPLADLKQWIADQVDPGTV